MFFTASAANAGSVDGMNKVKSSYSVEQTANKMATVLEKKGMTIFSRIDHASAAQEVGLELRDTVLLVFGNPKAGTLLMQCQQSVAIDLPLKALMWQDENNQVWVSYNNMAYLKTRHNMQGCEAIINKIAEGLQGIVQLSVK